MRWPLGPEHRDRWDPGASTSSQVIPVRSNIRMFLHRHDATHTCALCQSAVRKKPFRHRAHSHAKHSSHFWKPVGTHSHPCGELHAGSRRVCVSEKRAWRGYLNMYGFQTFHGEHFFHLFSNKTEKFHHHHASSACSQQ